MRRFMFIALAALLVSTTCAWANNPNSPAQTEDYPQELHLHLNRLTSAQAPRIIANYLVLSSQGVYRSVGAAFSHENWSTIHQFKKNTNGIFVLAIALPYGPARTVNYRLVLDGLWTTDPVNLARTIDRHSGLPVSVLELPERSIRVFGVWHPAVDQKDNTALFYYEGLAGQRVTVSGSFNGWDPFIHELKEVKPGTYELELKLPPGTYYYAFVYMGERQRDPLNKTVAWDSNGRQVSVLTIPQP